MSYDTDLAKFIEANGQAPTEIKPGVDWNVGSDLSKSFGFYVFGAKAVSRTEELSRQKAEAAGFETVEKSIPTESPARKEVARQKPETKDAKPEVKTKRKPDPALVVQADKPPKEKTLSRKTISECVERLEAMASRDETLNPVDAMKKALATIERLQSFGDGPLTLEQQNELLKAQNTLLKGLTQRKKRSDAKK